MFSVIKLKKSFWSAAGCAGYLFVFTHSLLGLGNTIIFVLNRSEFVPVLSFLGVGGYCFLTLR